MSQHSQENTPVFIKKRLLKRDALVKKRLQHSCFPCVYCQMFRNTYSKELLRKAAPASYPRFPAKGPILGSHLRVPP